MGSKGAGSPKEIFIRRDKMYIWNIVLTEADMEERDAHFERDV